MTPDCMTPDELALWQEANRILSARKRVSMPCVDCPAYFAAEMRAEGCCNGEPASVGRPRLVAYRPAGGQQGRRYDNEEDRRAARRQSWRDYKARQRAVA